MNDERRITRLEATTRRQLILLVILGAISAFLLMTDPTRVADLSANSTTTASAATETAPPISDVLRTRKVEIVNEQGKIVAILGLGKTEGGKLSIRNPEGDVAAEITMVYNGETRKHGGALMIYNRQGKIASSVEANPTTGTGSVYVNDQDGQTNIALTTFPGDPNDKNSSPSSSIGIYDSKRRRRAALMADDKHGSVSLSRSNGQTSTFATDAGIQTERVDINYPDGTKAVRLVEGNLSLYNRKGHLVISAIAQDDQNRSYLAFGSDEGKPMCVLGTERDRSDKDTKGGGFLNIANYDGKDTFRVFSTSSAERARVMALSDGNTKAGIESFIIDGKTLFRIVDSQGKVVHSFP